MATSDFEADLRRQVKGEVHSDLVRRGIHATDASHYQMMPQCVVAPADEADCLAAIRVAQQHKVPITARGAGTSLSGQTFGPGLVVDVSRHMDQIIEVDAEGQWARVQPGVIRDQLNQAVSEHKLHFAPDPATGSRATVGGMIGNNSSGTRSIVHGKTIDHVLEMRIALADGTVLECRDLDRPDWDAVANGDSREATLYKGIGDLIDKHEGGIKERFPNLMRRVSGYNFDEFVEGAGYTGDIGPRAERNAGHRPWNLGNLIVGSEGTLALLLEAKVRLTPLPKATAICVAHFTDGLDSLRAVAAINKFGPSAVELLDHVVLREAVVNPATRDMADFIEGEPEAVLLIEMSRDSEADAVAALEEMVDTLKEKQMGYSWPIRTDAVGQTNIWNTRKVGLGLISNSKGSVKGQAVIEDACVPVDVMPDYIAELIEFCESRNVPWSMYAHASVGVIHFRPMLDLHHQDQRDAMKAIAEDAFASCVKYGGVFAGEHGDGIVRGQFIPEFFGSELYEAFRELKQLFDPDGLMNPGKVLDTPSMIDAKLLRYGDAYGDTPIKSGYHHRAQGGFRLAVEQCNGVGACRKLGSGTMCPSYMALRDEGHSTRGRSNALRLAMSGQLGASPEEALASDGVKDLLSLCLSCKACKRECPNAVDVARLKGDVMHLRHQRNGVPLATKLLADVANSSRRMAGPIAPLVNALQGSAPGRWLIERLTGVDARRRLPALTNTPLLKRIKALPEAPTPSRGQVVLFADTFTQFYEPTVGVSALQLLRDAGYDVILESKGCCQRPRLSKGLLTEAKRDGEQTLRRLQPHAAEGLPILCLEPSCASALADDLPDLIDDETLGKTVSEQVMLLEDFIAKEDIKLRTKAKDIVVHGHCHQKALFGTKGLHAVLNRMDGVLCQEIASGCCGMAGSFGYENYDLSESIGEDRLFPAVREAVKQDKTVVACGISCRHQMHDFLGVKAQHWVELAEVEK